MKSRGAKAKKEEKAKRIILLGVSLDPSFKGPGVQISKILPHGSAAKGGAVEGDVVIQFDDSDLKGSLQDFVKVLKRAEPGVHELHVTRRDELIRLEVTLTPILQPKENMAVDKHRTLDSLCREDCECTRPLFEGEACVQVYIVTGEGPNGGVNILIVCRDTGGARFSCGPFEFF